MALLFEYVKADNVAALNAFTGNPHLVDKGGYNALMVAAKYRRANALKWCIENGVGRAGVDKEERKEGLTALMLACLKWSIPSSSGHVPIEQDNSECARILIRAGANPLKKDLSGRTCMHHAVLAKLPSIVIFLSSITEGPLLAREMCVAGFTPMQLLRNDLESAASAAAASAAASAATKSVPKSAKSAMAGTSTGEKPLATMELALDALKNVCPDVFFCFWEKIDCIYACCLFETG